MAINIDGLVDAAASVVLVGVAVCALQIGIFVYRWIRVTLDGGSSSYSGDRGDFGSNPNDDPF